MHSKLSVLFILFCLSTAAYSEVVSGRVVGVSDGDTITVLDANNTQYKIRLSGIDAPEKKQPFGSASKKSLSDMSFDKQVLVTYSKTDRYRRIVGRVLHDGKDINLEQIHRGMAWHYKKYMNDQPFEERLEYTKAEETARANRVGLWSESAATAPWEWRRPTK